MAPLEPPLSSDGARAELDRDRLRVLLVIPTLNEERHLESVVRRVIEGVPERRTTLVIVDGGSRDATVERAIALSEVFPNLYVLHNPKRIQSAAINLAARRFGRQADVLIRCDAHASYPPRFVPRLIDTLLRTRADSVVVPLDSLGSTCFQRAIALVSNSLLGTGGAAHRAGRRSGFVDHGHHAAFRLSTFLKVGGYDETFTHNEDAELDCRKRAFGARIYLDASIRVGYYPRATPRALFRQYYRYGAGRARTVRRHPGSIRVRQLAVPAHLLLCLTALLLLPWLPHLLSWPGLYLLALAAASLTFAARYRSLGALFTGPAAALMHVAWGAGFIVGFVTHREPGWHPSSTRPLWPGAVSGEPR